MHEVEIRDYTFLKCPREFIENLEHLGGLDPFLLQVQVLSWVQINSKQFNKFVSSKYFIYLCKKLIMGKLKYTKELLIGIVAESKSIAEVLRRLDLKMVCKI